VGICCLVWFPAPGHSVMMSSLASVLVAKANATPEKVVPCVYVSAVSHVQCHSNTHEVDSHNQLGLTSALALHL
jgi:hypothetical protein